MSLFVRSFILHVVLVDTVFASTSGVTSTGDIYICLADGTPCPTVGFGGQMSVDPRIVTPVRHSLKTVELEGPYALNDLCPSGYFPCYGIETQCGDRFVDPIDLNDGKADMGAHPWQAFMSNLTHIFSGSGALLDPFHVLTIAHKVDGNRDKPEDITVYMGVWDPTNLEDAQESPVKEVVIHPSYNEESLLNDIAILRLEHPVVLGIQEDINTICLPESEANFTGTNCMVSGWGQTSFTIFDAPTSPQKQVTVTVVDPATCRESFARPSLLGGYVDMYLDQVGEICAGGEAMRDACTQDGGSPLTCPDATGKLTVTGLVVWGKNCGQPGVFGVYVNVPYYSSWIETTVESLNEKYGRR